MLATASFSLDSGSSNSFLTEIVEAAIIRWPLQGCIGGAEQF